MNPENHERARQLMAAARIGDITRAERDWLDDHLASCRECAAESTSMDAAISFLRAAHVEASPELLLRTRRAVQQRAVELESAGTSSAPLWIATAVSTICMVLTAPFAWGVFGWAGRLVNIPQPIWQAAFVMWWFLPATLLAAAAAWKKSEMNWGHQ
jgi:anti-sigma factor RsiW